MYCEKCGKKCIELKCSDGYNKYTGEKKFRKKVFCPELSKYGGFGVYFTGIYYGHNVYN